MVLAVACGAPGDAGPVDWERLGEFVDAGETNLEPYLLSIAVDPTTDHPVVSLQDDPGPSGNLVRVTRWSGTAWEVLGPSPAELGVAGTVATRASDVAVGADGTVWLLWMENDLRRRDSQNLHVARWSGSAWEVVGGNLVIYPIIEDLDPSNDVRSPTIVLDPSGAAWVAWVESPGDGASLDLQLKRWDGAAWIDELGGALASDNEDYDVRLGFDDLGRPILVWETVDVGTTSSVVVVARKEGGAWERLGALNGGEVGYQRAPDLAVAPGGVDLYVSYRGGAAGGADLFVDHWDGEQWVDAGVAVEDGAGVNVGTASVTVDALGRPVVAWSQQLDGQTGIFVKRRGGDGWELLEGELDGPKGNNFAPVIAVDSANAPIVVWDDGSAGDRHAVARRWTGAP
jgi:hypothetical protein